MKKIDIKKIDFRVLEPLKWENRMGRKFLYFRRIWMTALLCVLLCDYLFAVSG